MLLLQVHLLHLNSRQTRFLQTASPILYRSIDILLSIHFYHLTTLPRTVKHIRAG